MSAASQPDYVTLRPGRGRDALVLGVHPANCGRILVIYGGHRVPVDGFHHRFREIGRSLSAGGHAAVVHASDPQGSRRDLSRVLEYVAGRAREITGASSPDLYLSGHSAGATAAAKVAGNYHVKRLLLVAPPSAVDLSEFTGELYGFVGSRDHWPLAATRQTNLSAEKAASRQMVVLRGGDHVFHTPAQDEEYRQAFYWVAGAADDFALRRGRTTYIRNGGSSAELLIHPARSDRVIVIYGATNAKVEGWQQRYIKLARELARADDAAVIQVENLGNPDDLRRALAFVKAHAQEITGNHNPEIALMGHAGGAVAAGSLAAESGADRLLLVAPKTAPEISGYRGQLFLMSGASDDDGVRGAKAAYDAASATRQRQLVVVENADRAFHTPETSEKFVAAFRWAAGLDRAFPQQRGHSGVIDGIAF